MTFLLVLILAAIIWPRGVEALLTVCLLLILSPILVPAMCIEEVLRWIFPKTMRKELLKKREDRNK